MTIERAAKAIKEFEGGQFEVATHVQLARAALEAIAEPTPEMIKAGKLYFGLRYADEFVRKGWQAMHAAMMNS